MKPRTGWRGCLSVLQVTVIKLLHKYSELYHKEFLCVHKNAGLNWTRNRLLHNISIFTNLQYNKSSNTAFCACTHVCMCACVPVCMCACINCVHFVPATHLNILLIYK
jgi:hypothetical protein